MRAGSQVPGPGDSVSQRSPAQALPESESPQVPDQPGRGTPQLFAPPHLSPGVRVGPARGCQGELSDSGAGGRLRGRSET